MNNSRISISQILATGLAGAFFFSLANSPALLALPGEAMLAIAVSAAIIGFAVFDYSRRVQPLTIPCRVVRPGLPAGTAARSTAASRGNFHGHDRAA